MIASSRMTAAMAASPETPFVIIQRSIHQCLHNILEGTTPFQPGDYFVIKTFRQPLLDAFLAYVCSEAKNYNDSSLVGDAATIRSDFIIRSLSLKLPAVLNMITNHQPPAPLAAPKMKAAAAAAAATNHQSPLTILFQDAVNDYDDRQQQMVVVEPSAATASLPNREEDEQSLPPPELDGDILHIKETNEDSDKLVYVTPESCDVLCGRGRLAFRHPGNCRLRARIGLSLETYNTSGSRTDKTQIIRSIIRSVAKTGGKFLKKDSASKQWYDGGIAAAKNRVGAAFRDASVPCKVKCMDAMKSRINMTNTLDPPQLGRFVSFRSTEGAHQSQLPTISSSAKPSATAKVPTTRQVAYVPTALDKSQLQKKNPSRKDAAGHHKLLAIVLRRVRVNMHRIMSWNDRRCRHRSTQVVHNDNTLLLFRGELLKGNTRCINTMLSYVAEECIAVCRHSFREFDDETVRESVYGNAKRWKMEIESYKLKNPVVVDFDKDEPASIKEWKQSMVRFILGGKYTSTRKATATSVVPQNAPAGVASKYTRSRLLEGLNEASVPPAASAADPAPPLLVASGCSSPSYVSTLVGVSYQDTEGDSDAYSESRVDEAKYSEEDEMENSEEEEEEEEENLAAEEEETCETDLDANDDDIHKDAGSVYEAPLSKRADNRLFADIRKQIRVCLRQTQQQTYIEIKRLDPKAIKQFFVTVASGMRISSPSHALEDTIEALAQHADLWETEIKRCDSPDDDYGVLMDIEEQPDSNALENTIEDLAQHVGVWETDIERRDAPGDHYDMLVDTEEQPDSDESDQEVKDPPSRRTAAHERTLFQRNESFFVPLLKRLRRSFTYPKNGRDVKACLLEVLVNMPQMTGLFVESYGVLELLKLTKPFDPELSETIRISLEVHLRKEDMLTSPDCKPTKRWSLTFAPKLAAKKTAVALHAGASTTPTPSPHAELTFPKRDSNADALKRTEAADLKDYINAQSRRVLTRRAAIDRAERSGLDIQTMNDVNQAIDVARHRCTQMREALHKHSSLQVAKTTELAPRRLIQVGPEQTTIAIRKPNGSGDADEIHGLCGVNGSVPVNRFGHACNLVRAASSKKEGKVPPSKEQIRSEHHRTPYKASTQAGLDISILSNKRRRYSNGGEDFTAAEKGPTNNHDDNVPSQDNERKRKALPCRTDQMDRDGSTNRNIATNVLNKPGNAPEEMRARKTKPYNVAPFHHFPGDNRNYQNISDEEMKAIVERVPRPYSELWNQIAFVRFYDNEISEQLASSNDTGTVRPVVIMNPLHVHADIRRDWVRMCKSTNFRPYWQICLAIDRGPSEGNITNGSSNAISYQAWPRDIMTAQDQLQEQVQQPSDQSLPSTVVLQVD